MTDPDTALGVVLAAGRSQRAGAPKALAVCDGDTFVARTVACLRLGGCSRVRVVVGPPHGAAIEDALSGLADCQVVWNHGPDRGMLGSVQVALRPSADGELSPAHVVIALVDHPRVSPRTVEALLAHARRRQADVTLPVYGERSGHPFVINASTAAHLAQVAPDGTLRQALGERRLVERLTVPDAAVLDDLDTREAIEALGARLP